VKIPNHKYLQAGFAAASTCALAGAFYGCSGDDTIANPVTDAGPADVATDHSLAADTSILTDAALTDGSLSDGTVSTPQQKVSATLLFSDLADAGAAKTDPNLVNPWGLAFSGTGTAWVSDNGTGLATTYTPTSLGPLVVTVPMAIPDGGTGTPTGQIFNGTAANFGGDVFILATEDGTIQGWQRGPTDAAPPGAFTIHVNNSAAGASYKGLAIVPATPPVLVAADFANAKLVAWDATYAPIVPDGGGAWTHPTLPAGYSPFNIVTIGTTVYVAYALHGTTTPADPMFGAGAGIVSAFATDGTFVKDVVALGGGSGVLNAPWGMVMAPAAWGTIGGSLLVGNFGDGMIHSFDPTSGALTSTLVTPSGGTLAFDGLWALVFGVDNVDAGESSTQLYFTAGINAEKDGLFGFLTPQ
jgi:uncharacterized protein (TIGR03118 family)